MRISAVIILIFSLSQTHVFAVPTNYTCQFLGDAVKVTLDEDSDPPLSDKCLVGVEAFYCWESQLLDTTRTYIIAYMNDFKERMARRGIADVFKLQYHWYLEVLAQWAFKDFDCQIATEPRTLLIDDQRMPKPNAGYDLGGVTFGSGEDDYKKLTFRLAAVKVDEPDPDELNTVQTDALSKFLHLIQNPMTSDTFFQTWEYQGGILVNNIGKADLFGCVMLIQDRSSGNLEYDGYIDKPTRIGILACVFAGKSQDLNSPRGTTTNETCKGLNAAFDAETLMCYYPSPINDTLTKKKRLPCQLYYHTDDATLQSQKCEEYIPPDWSELLAPKYTDQMLVIISAEQREVIVDPNVRMTTLIGRRPTPTQKPDKNDDQNEESMQMTVVYIFIPILFIVGLFLTLTNVFNK